MKPFVSPQQIKVFSEQGFIAYDQVVAAEKLLPLRGKHWFESAQLKQIAAGRMLPSLLASLAKEPTIRMGWDRWIESPLLLRCLLEELGSVNGLVGGILVCASARDLSASPLRAGDAVVVAPRTPFDWGLYTDDMIGYLITYTFSRARYLPRDDDPLLAQWKQWGYSAGDALKAPQHPLLPQQS